MVEPRCPECGGTFETCKCVMWRNLRGPQVRRVIVERLPDGRLRFTIKEK